MAGKKKRKSKNGSGITRMLARKKKAMLKAENEYYRLLAGQANRHFVNS